MALADDAFSTGKTGRLIRNVLENDANLFGELDGRVTHFDGRELPWDAAMEFLSPMGVKVVVRADGQVEYDPRAVIAFRSLRTGQSITESFVYRVNNFIVQREAKVSFTVYGGSRWHNASLPLDVNADRSIDPLDVLVLINYINAFSARNLDDEIDGLRSSDYLDVDNDSALSPLDVLLVINWLNHGNGPTGEGEGSDTAEGFGLEWFPSSPCMMHAWDSVEELKRRRGK
jgi:hypothetical protein